MPTADTPLLRDPRFKPVLPVARPATQAGLRASQLFWKRILDLSIAFPLCLLCAPLAVLLCAWIRLGSTGAAIYRQTRVGFGGREFVLYKFRSMHLSPENPHSEYALHWIRGDQTARQPNGVFKLTTDCRITRVGKFLRKYSLDELPQLLNVITGDMSLVGPRPAISYEVAQYEPWQRQRLHAPPGLTGLWQVSGRNHLSFERMVELDLEYIRTWTLRSDLRILLQTIPVVLRGTGH